MSNRLARLSLAFLRGNTQSDQKSIRFAQMRSSGVFVAMELIGRVAFFLFDDVTKGLQSRTTECGGVCGDSRMRRPMDIVLASALFILVAGCVVGYSIRAETDSDRPAEPRRRPF